jgi:hypothetical protein
MERGHYQENRNDTGTPKYRTPVSRISLGTPEQVSDDTAVFILSLHPASGYLQHL